MRVSALGLCLSAALVSTSANAHEHLRPPTGVRYVMGAPVTTAQPLKRLPTYLSREQRPIMIVFAEPRSVAPPARRVSSSSVSPVDSGATVSKTASGRVFIGPTPGLLLTNTGQAVPAAPRAQPSFQLLGAPSGRNMQGDVKLGFGIQPADVPLTQPKVVFLSEDGQAAPARNIRRVR